MNEIPEFLRESAEDSDELLAYRDCVASFEDVPTDAFEMKPERLLMTVEEAPLRYAPFYDRVAELLQASVPQVEEMLSPDGFKRSPLRGIRYKNSPVPLGAGIVGTVVKFDAGVKYPHHRHRHDERLLIIEGGYTDESGRHFGPGDLHEMPAGSEHGFSVDADGPCVAISVADEKLEFSSPLLRFLARLIGR